ncbi:MAG: MFS transporter, partial [Rhodospirillales bacterium]|nr:MFS transporter [Rhodospirillales bacterium]
MHSWGEVARRCRDRRVATLFALGFSAGLPILLIFSTLSVWLSEAGMARADITLLSWAALGYGFKYVWAPIIDRMPAPVLTHLMGQRRSWLLIAQISIMAALLGMAWTDPAHSAATMAGFAVMLGFSSATQDIVIDAYRIEVADVDLQGILSAAYIAGYRVGMIVAGAGSLEIAGLLDTSGGGYDYDAWAWTYTIMACVMLVGVATTFLVREPDIRREAESHQETTTDHVRFFLVFLLCAGVFVASFIYSAGWTSEIKSIFVDAGLGKPFAGFIGE